MRSSSDRCSGEDQNDAVALAIHQPVFEDAEAARKRLQACNDGEVDLSAEEELQLTLRMSAGLDSQRTWALLEEPELYARHFLGQEVA